MKTLTAALAAAGLLASSAAFADARQEVIDAFQKAMADGSYRMNMVASTRQGPMRTQMDVQMPNRFHMKNDQGEFVILPDGTWINAGGQWMKVPMNMAQMIEGYTADAMEQGIAAIQQVSYVGEETVEGCASKHYTYSASGKFMGVSSNSDIALWVCQDDGLPIKLESVEKGKDDSVSIVYDWDAPIDIRAPR